MSIPIENLYYLLCYAWNRLEESELVAVDATAAERPAELFASILTNGVAHLLKRGIDRGYLPVEEEIAGIRGKLNLGDSIKHASFTGARAWCTRDELTPDVMHNRIVKTVIRRLALVSDLQPELRSRLHSVYRRMPGVSDIAGPISRSRSRVMLHRNNAFYGFLLDVCELIDRNLLTNESTGETLFRDFTRDEEQMNRVFEQFLREFYRRELHGYRVDQRSFAWQRAGVSPGDRHLPEMRTDIVLEGHGRTIVADAKYYARTLTDYHGKGSVHAGNLYQLFAYMSNIPRRQDDTIQGMLIYPQVGPSVRIDTMLQQFPVTIVTIDLGQPWRGIADDLRGLVLNMRSAVPA